MEFPGQNIGLGSLSLLQEIFPIQGSNSSHLHCRWVLYCLSHQGSHENVQTTIRLCSFHMLVRLCSKSFKLGFSSTWTEKFQMYKLSLGKARNQRSNFQHPLDHRKSKSIPEKHLFLFHWLSKTFDCVDHNKLWKILKEMEITDHLTCLLRNLYVGHETKVRTLHRTTE